MSLLKEIKKKWIIKKFNLFAGKRKIVNPTPFGALAIAKAKNRKNDIETLTTMVHEYRKWKNMRLRDYSKPWQTRIKKKRAFYKRLAQEFLEVEEFRAEYGDPNHEYIDMYDEMATIDCRSATDSVCFDKWPSYVDYYFSGDEQEAYKNFDYYKLFHERRK